MQRILKISTIISTWLLIFLSSGNVYAGLVNGYQYIFPPPGARFVHPSAKIIIRFNHARPADLINFAHMIKITGSVSGSIVPEPHIASDNRTIIFTPSQDFAPGEMVSIELTPEFLHKDQVTPFNYSFNISPTPLSVPSGNPLSYGP